MVASHFHGLNSSLELCCEGPWFTSIQEDGCDKGMHQLYLGAERNTPVIPNVHTWLCDSVRRSSKCGVTFCFTNCLVLSLIALSAAWWTYVLYEWILLSGFCFVSLFSSVSVCVCLSLSLFLSLSVSVSHSLFVCLSLSLSLFLSLSLPLCLPVSLSLSLYVCLSVCLSLPLPLCLCHSVSVSPTLSLCLMFP